MGWQDTGYDTSLMPNTARVVFQEEKGCMHCGMDFVVAILSLSQS